ncbi:Syntaxin-16 [Drechslerella dactyloides]|uniref:Syntaxin-16 n=1 Tax=Drechslerella dactyloides TaxID=74499 RepID=A0AAD6J2N6_DREDA|nr:Syntaxin-16 [Drechslerella dactyloides]
MQDLAPANRSVSLSPSSQPPSIYTSSTSTSTIAILSTTTTSSSKTYDLLPSYSHRPAKRPRFAPANDYQDEDRRGLLSADDFDTNGHADSAGGGDAIIEMDRLPPRWADISDEVAEHLADIARMSSKLDKLHAKHVLPGFDDNSRSAEEGEIESLTTDITAKFHECQAAIKRIERLAKAASATASSNAEEVMSRNIQISLATKVQASSASFRKKQAAYLKRLRGLSGFTPPIERSGSPNPAYTATSSLLLDEENDISYSRTALQQSATLTSNDNTIMQREREITDIANGILELADIFKELQTMIIDQGTLLDRIDYNVELMKTNVRAAEKELVVASGYQRRSTKRKAMLLLVICIVGVIILLSLKPRRGGGDAAAAHPPLPDGKEAGVPGLMNPGGGNRINHPGGGGDGDPGGGGGTTGDPDATTPVRPKESMRVMHRRGDIKRNSRRRRLASLEHDKPPGFTHTIYTKGGAILPLLLLLLPHPQMQLHLIIALPPLLCLHTLLPLLFLFFLADPLRLVRLALRDVHLPPLHHDLALALRPSAKLTLHQLAERALPARQLREGTFLRHAAVGAEHDYPLAALDRGQTDYDVRFFDDCPRDCDSLPLAAAELRPSWSDWEAYEIADELAVRAPGSAHNLLPRRSRLPVRNILSDRAGEQHGLLRYYADLTPQRLDVELFQIHAVDQNPPGVRTVKPK